MSPDAQGLIARTTMEVDDRVRFDREWATAVRVVVEGGDAREEMVPLAIGKVGRWFSEADMKAKFLDCARGTVSAERAQRLFSIMRSLPALASLSTLQAELQQDAERPPAKG